MRRLQQHQWVIGPQIVSCHFNMQMMRASIIFTSSSNKCTTSSKIQYPVISRININLEKSKCSLFRIKILEMLTLFNKSKFVAKWLRSKSNNYNRGTKIKILILTKMTNCSRCKAERGINLHRKIIRICLIRIIHISNLTL